MTTTWAKKIRTTPKPWDGDEPVQCLSLEALELLELIRESADLGRSFRKARAVRVLGWASRTVNDAAREIRSSVFAGCFRPRPRVRIPRSTRIRVFNRDGWACVSCGCRVQASLTLGHFPVPYGKGGSDHHTNLRTECDLCNAARGDAEGEMS